MTGFSVSWMKCNEKNVLKGMEQVIKMMRLERANALSECVKRI